MAIKQMSEEKKAENVEKSRETGKRPFVLNEAFMPKWDSMAEAVKAGATRVDEALDFAIEAKKGHADITGSLGLSSRARTPNWVIQNYGEEHVGGLMRYICERRTREYLAHNYTPYEDLLLDAEEQRLISGLFEYNNNLKIWEEEDRYVLSCLCGGIAGYARRMGLPTTLKKAYPWTWNRTDVPVSYVEQAIKWEIIPTELRGYPVRIIMMGDTVDDPDLHYIYKKPELIPKEYFERIGNQKPGS